MIGDRTLIAAPARPEMGWNAAPSYATGRHGQGRAEVQQTWFQADGPAAVGYAMVGTLVAGPGEPVAGANEDFGWPGRAAEVSPIDDNEVATALGAELRGREGTGHPDPYRARLVDVVVPRAVGHTAIFVELAVARA